MLTDHYPSERYVDNAANGGPTAEPHAETKIPFTLADALIARGRDIDLVLCRVEGAYLDDVPAAARIVELKPTTRLRARLTALKAK